MQKVITFSFILIFILSFRMNSHEGWEATQYPFEQAHALVPYPTE